MSIPESPPAAGVHVQWGIRIPLRDGIKLHASVYCPRMGAAPVPVIVTLTPYIGQTYHERGVHFAAHGYVFVTVDVRGRGNSEGVFTPYINEADDAYDVVEWLARQDYCNGRVTMWGGSYGGYVQWAAAGKTPPHLASIVPVAAPCLGVDFPIRNNIAWPYWMQWLTLVAGRTSQDKLFADQDFWNQQFRAWFESGVPFGQLDRFLGHASRIFQEWLAHPHQDDYWDRHNPRPQDYARIAIPILTITGAYDADQPGALMHYRTHLLNASSQARAQHYLVIGPWDHAGTRSPSAECGGLKFGPDSLVDMNKLHRDWYAWTLQGGPKPEFLQRHVAYYVMGAEKWRYADSLHEVTAAWVQLFLDSDGHACDVFRAGSLSLQPPARGGCDQYVHDPRDVSLAALESTIDLESRVDQRMLHASRGKQLVYHSEPFEQDTEISGFFRLSLWLAIDQPDTDFRVALYEIDAAGNGILLSSDAMRARYRKSLREENPIRTLEPLCYDFTRFMFVSRVVRRGSRLRFVVGPLHSIHSQKSYNSDRPVSEQSVADARAVTVRLFHDREHLSVLHVPLGQPDV